MNPLSQLKDIHLPKPISWWPLAPGWYILAALIIILCAGVIIYFLKRKRRHQIRGKALQHLQTLQKQELDDSEYVSEISVLLKRCALGYYARKEVAPLTGTAWLNFLDEKGKTEEFSEGVGQVLLDSAYKPSVQVNRDSLHKLVEAWLRRQPC